MSFLHQAMAASGGGRFHFSTQSCSKRDESFLGMLRANMRRELRLRCRSQAPNHLSLRQKRRAEPGIAFKVECLVLLTLQGLNS